METLPSKAGVGSPDRWNDVVPGALAGSCGNLRSFQLPLTKGHEGVYHHLTAPQEMKTASHSRAAVPILSGSLRVWFLARLRIARGAGVLTGKGAEPKATLGSPFLRYTIAAMKRAPAPKSRRRSPQPLSRKTFVYLTDEERKLVDQAATVERRSVSSFIANAAVDAAERIITRHSRKS